MVTRGCTVCVPVRHFGLESSQLNCLKRARKILSDQLSSVTFRNLSSPVSVLLKTTAFPEQNVNIQFEMKTFVTFC